MWIWHFVQCYCGSAFSDNGLRSQCSCSMFPLQIHYHCEDDEIQICLACRKTLLLLQQFGIGSWTISGRSYTF
ncbi:hypothetical protein PFISCL1PPCAC_14423 [Pristionchus fissidentatus]|uniref:Uncharacterized protein n=1 Tax=Pristionchus fissidentatus TaxID=1538716 RepID=A0AAV5VUF7_9BILA|nr:hypothetical protein PFISCL1PPCAC_14423 [Pristionchus fissidentatus]